MQTRYKPDTKRNMLTFANMMPGIYPKIPQGRYSDLLGCMLENDEMKKEPMERPNKGTLVGSLKIYL